MGETNTSSAIKWFAFGAVFGLIAYPFYAAVLGPDPKAKKLKAARS